MEKELLEIGHGFFRDWRSIYVRNVHCTLLVYSKSAVLNLYPLKSVSITQQKSKLMTTDLPHGLIRFKYLLIARRQFLSTDADVFFLAWIPTMLICKHSTVCR